LSGDVGGERRDLIVTAPVYGSEEATDQLLGVVVYIAKALPTQNDVASHTLALAGRAVLLFVASAGMVGALFGFVTARRMSGRFQRLARATQAWSRGDFSGFIVDPSGDEISQLARSLNSMAGQLQELLQRRQAMAISEERNRLARDLHDSAKQQALAASFQLGTAITLFDRDPQAAEEHLMEAEALVDSVRRELTDLILELRPSSAEVSYRESPSMDARDFAQILRDYAVEWAHQNGVEVDVSVRRISSERDGTSSTGDDRCELPLALTQTLYRITQEALANVARHSGAGWVRLELICGDSGSDEGRGSITLIVADDGCGFDTGKRHGGMGLRSMRERAESLDGTFGVESEPGQGTRITVTVPIGVGAS
jgi:NarL family two-component system sensor histidine kinase LiaS